MLDPILTDQILVAWQADQEHPNRGRAKRPLPPLPAIRRLLDECFLATLRDEEGHPIRFSVGLVWGDDFQQLEQPLTSKLLRMTERVDFSAATLAKLSPAFDPSLTTIIVIWNEDEQSLQYWGIRLHAKSTNRFSEIPVAMEGLTGVGLDCFTLISRGRAALAIARGHGLIGILQAGYFKQAIPTPFTSNSLGRYIYEGVQTDPLFIAEGMTYWHLVRDGLEVILAESASRGHGGTIVLLPSDVGLAASYFQQKQKHKLEGSFDLKNALHKCIEHKADFVFSVGYRRAALESIQRISQLTAIDGALVLTFDFQVIAFGATLTAPRSKAIPVIGPDGFGRATGQPFDIDRYGTRHRSAMDFVEAVPGAIAFVISQDGPIRAFRRDDGGTVHVWPDCTTSMFV
jgi:hypothetical protein